MKIKEKNSKGITLVALVITITVILILVSVVTYNGIEAINTAKLNKFIAEMKIMQMQINDIYDKYKNGESIEEYTGENIINNIGKPLSESKNTNKVFTETGSGITEKNGYRYFDAETIKKLGIEDIEEEFFVNIKKRSIISVNGFKYNGNIYYTMEQIPSSLYNVEYEEKDKKLDFSVNCDLIGENKYKIIIIPNYSDNIEKWQVKYKLDGEQYWNISDNLEFVIEKSGKYSIQIQNDNIQSSIEEKYLGYILDGLMVHYDGIINTRIGNNRVATAWQDLSGNKNDGVLKNSPIWQSNCLKFDGIDDYVLIGKHNYENITLEVVVENNYINNGETEYICNYENGGYGLSYKNNKNFMQIYTANEGNTTYSTNNIVVNKKYSLSGTYNLQNLNMYENGIKNTANVTAKISYSKENIPLCLGVNFNGNTVKGNFLNGKIYSVRVYNRALTEEEVKINYEVDKSRFNIE